MSAESKVKVVLCWHMHQPQYCDNLSGKYQLPWTYLHAIKDYVDMAGHLEAEEGARAVVNFAPTLLEQIADYADQTAAFLRDGTSIRDPLLNALACPALPSGNEERLSLIRACLRAHETRMIERFPAFSRLVRMANWVLEHGDCLHYLSDQFIVDLLMWYHLAWLGETVRRSDLRVQQLQTKEADFSVHDRRQLMKIIGELLGELIPRYRRLAESGRVELSVTPYAHPIVPLLLDFESARDAMPNAELPAADAYPGGEQRVVWHIEAGIATFESHFGFRPRGCWPSEGGVSDAALQQFGKAGFRWVASGESVLFNSLARDPAYKEGNREQKLYRPYRVTSKTPACFFRDDGLSDMIGFQFSDWHADDAVANLVHNLEIIAEQTPKDEQRVVSIIMDGENAWEHYPENAYYFLSAMYRRLAEHSRIDLTTFSDCLDNRVKPVPLAGLVAGSWVYGTFSTWIADKDKNRGWDMLVDAKRSFDRVAQANRHTAEQWAAIETQMAICEGSDWFWWFGDYNPSDTVNDFDRLYRVQLTNLYLMLGEEPPEYLAHAFTHGTGSPALGGVMRHGQPASG